MRAIPDLETADLLDRAADRTEGGHWCQGTPAHDALGRDVDPLDPSACHWCMGGAMIYAAAGDSTAVAHVAVRRYLGLPQRGGLVGVWNDRPGRTEAEAVAALRGAAEMLREGATDAR